MSVSRCGRSCNTIDHPYAQVYVPNKVKHVSENVDMKVYVIQSKNGIVMNVGVSVKNQIIRVLLKRVILSNPSTCDCECNKPCKLTSI